MVGRATQFQTQSAAASTGCSAHSTPVDERIIAEEVLGPRRGHRKGVGRVLRQSPYASSGCSGSTASYPATQHQQQQQDGELPEDVQQYLRESQETMQAQSAYIQTMDTRLLLQQTRLDTTEQLVRDLTRQVALLTQGMSPSSTSTSSPSPVSPSGHAPIIRVPPLPSRFAPRPPTPPPQDPPADESSDHADQ